MSSATGTPSSAYGTVSDRGSSVKQSPASTYGESVASDIGGCPQTPAAENDEGVMIGSIAKLSMGDEKPVECYTPPFVRVFNGAHGAAEDPFTTKSPRRGSGQATPIGPKSKNRAAMSDNWRSGSSSGSSSGNSPTSPTRYLVGKRGTTLFIKEYENENDIADFYKVVTPEASQAVFPPASCVFVANLLQSETDEALEVAVTEVFREFGSVWVKIRRDPRHMPFAFCQYQFPEEAERAIREGRGRLIKGRPCRCEKAKAHRLFFIERKYGTVITPQEAAHLLRGFGKLDFIRPANAFELAQMNLNEGVIVQFQMYDDGQNAMQAFRNHEVYKMQSMANMCSPTRSTFGVRSNPADRQYLETYEVDKRSVFVGNLPVEIEEKDLEEKFKKYGTIHQITLHRNESTLDATQMHCFAFIEFVNAAAVPFAIKEMNHSVILEKTIRVNQKDSEAAKKHRNKLQDSAPAASSQSPTRPSVVQSQPSTGQQPVTPMTHVSPHGYGQSYALTYGSPYYGYPGTGYFADAQGQYYPISPYGYSPYAYSGSPQYASGTSSTADAAGNPNDPQGYHGYYSPYAAQYWGFSSPTAQQPMWYAPAYSPPAASNVQEDRSATPTPTGHTTNADSTMESQ